MVRFDFGQVQAYIRSQPPYKGCKGSVVRLFVTDFMTYHSVELIAGAHVNLILGPNGTGKSTIVCAICLGLAGKPKILGRALSLKEYIRHGANSATIEIELYNPDGLNYVIKRHIKVTTTGGTLTRWYLQGKRASPNEVEQRTSSLNIQLDNLCQFLPQDRVQEFVVMDSFSLLQNTQKALGNDTLCQRHDALINLTSTRQEIERTLKSHANTLRSAQQYTKRLEKDVESFREREALTAKITDLTSKKAWIVYIKSREDFSSLQAELKVATETKKLEEANLAPLRRSLESLETTMAKYQEELNKSRATFQTKLNGIKRKVAEDMDRVETEITSEQTKFKELERSEMDREKRVEIVTGKIREGQNELEEIRLKGDLDETRLRNEKATHGTHIGKLDDSILEINGEDEKDESERQYLQNKIRDAELELSRIDNLRVSRLKFLEREQPDVYETVQYFSKPENRAGFNGPIHEPMILHISVNDLKYDRVAERQIGLSELTGFFCENADDVEIMLSLNDKRKKRVSVTHFEGPGEGPYRRAQKHFPAEFMRKWGFEKSVMDIIDGPDYYLAYLADRFQLQNILIGSESTGKLFQEIEENTDITLFYTEKGSFRIKQSNYSHSKVTSYRGLPVARIMTTEINATEKERIQESVLQWRSGEKLLQEKINGRSTRLVELQEERQTVEDKIRDINARFEYGRGRQKRLEAAKKQLETLEREKKDLPSLRAVSDRVIWGHRQNMVRIQEFLTREMTKLQDDGSKTILLRKQVHLVQAKIITRENEFQQMTGAVKECEARIRNLTTQVDAAARDAEANKRDAIAKSDKITEPPADVISGEGNMTEVDKELNQANVQLKFLMDADPSIVRDYQENMQKIQNLTKEKEDGEKNLSSIQSQIEEQKEAWLNPLTELIGTVNTNFGRFFASMGCAGEVVLHKGADENDFAKYGIKILVKFRSSEPLSELGGSKGGTLQSGGERVISTALYILALQELTTVPFRVIDEINQGMDATNEARFFNLLCTLARGPNTPQYFLLTPKMLPPVDYPDNVDFHIIMSGPHVNVPVAGITAIASAGSSDDDGGEED